MQFGKLKYIDVMQLDIWCAGIYKAANQGAPFILLAVDWLYPQQQR